MPNLHLGEREISVLYDGGLPLDDAWIEYNGSNDKEVLESIRDSQDDAHREKIKTAREELAKMIRCGDLIAIGVRSISLHGGRSLEAIRPEIFRMRHVDWAAENIRDGDCILRKVRVAYQGMRHNNRRVAEIGGDDSKLGAYGAVDAGMKVLLQYIKSNEDWSGAFNDAVVTELNKKIMDRYSGGPYFATQVVERTWRNYSYELRKELEKLGIPKPRRWK